MDRKEPVEDSTSLAAIGVHLQYIRQGLADIKGDVGDLRSEIEALGQELRNDYVPIAKHEALAKRIEAELESIRDELKGKSLTEQIKTAAVWAGVVGAGGAALLTAIKTLGAALVKMGG